MTTARTQSQNRSLTQLLIALTIIALAVQFLERSMLSRAGTFVLIIAAWWKGLSLIYGKKWLGYLWWIGFVLWVMITLYPMVQRLSHGG